MKINEIFYSLQGEGTNAGKAAVFVRFSGCNIKCPFCDTEHQKFSTKTEEEIVDEVCKYPTKLVVLTGGEPSLFLTESFIDKLHARNKRVAIETNGTREISSKVDFVTISPKFEFVKNAKIVPQHCNELKVVFNGKNDMSLYDDVKADNFFIQPCDVGDPVKNEEILSDAINFIKENPKWRLSLQTQKILKIR